MIGFQLIMPGKTLRTSVEESLLMANRSVSFADLGDATNPAAYRA